MKAIAIFIFFISINSLVNAQTNTEFTKGFVLHLQLQQGVYTNFHKGADLYVASLMALPQFTVMPGRMRMGAAGGIYYFNKSFLAAGGPLINYKLKTFKAGPIGSVANLNVRAQHIWMQQKNSAAGIGLQLDMFNKIQLSLMAQRVYLLNSWLFETGIGLRLSKIKKDAEPFNN